MRPDPLSSAVTSTSGSPGSPVSLKTAGSRPTRERHPVPVLRQPGGQRPRRRTRLGRCGVHCALPLSHGPRLPPTALLPVPAMEVAEGLRLAEDHREQGRAGNLHPVRKLQELPDVAEAMPLVGFPVPGRAFRQAGPLAPLAPGQPCRRSVDDQDGPEVQAGHRAAHRLGLPRPRGQVVSRVWVGEVLPAGQRLPAQAANGPQVVARQAGPAAGYAEPRDRQAP